MMTVKSWKRTAAVHFIGLICASRAADTNSLPAIAPSTNGWGAVTLWTGAKLENPYAIARSAGGATLVPARSSTDGYLELNLNTRYILRSGQYESMPMSWGRSANENNAMGVFHLVPFWAEMPDIEARIGYIFRGASSPTNLSISTIVGAADLYSDAALGWPLLRYASGGDFSQQVKEQVTAEIDGGFATDKNFLAVHPNLFIGGGWQGKFPAPNLTGQSLPTYLCGRVGMARVDEPRLLRGAAIALDRLGEPVFDAAWAPSVGIQIVYPINSAVNLQAGGNVYFTTSPASWNLNLGLTLDLGKFFSTLSK